MSWIGWYVGKTARQVCQILKRLPPVPYEEGIKRDIRVRIAARKRLIRELLREP